MPAERTGHRPVSQITQRMVPGITCSRRAARRYPVDRTGLAVTTAARITKQPGRGHHGSASREQRVLEMIENDLRITDQQLAAAFAAFTAFASGTRMPGLSG